MGEQFRKIVNAPHKAFGRARKKLQEMQADTRTKKAARAAGVGLTGMFQFLLWATKYATLDNHALRALEELLRDMKVGKNKEGNDKKLSAFMKKYPNFSSHMLYYLMFAMTAGGVRAYQELSGEEQIPETQEITVGMPDVGGMPVYEENTYGAYLAKMRPVTPLLIADLILPEGVCMENGKHVVYDDKVAGKKLKPGQRPRGKATIGFGSTVLKDSTIVTSYTPPISSEYAYELARHHIEEHETYFVMYCYETAVPKSRIDDTGVALMVGSALYNLGSQLIEEPQDKNHRERFAELRRVRDEYGAALPDSVVRAAFDKYPIVAPTSFGKIFLGQEKGNMGDAIGNFLKGGDGLIWRRWLEAGIASGKVRPEEILDIPIGGMSDFYYLMKKRAGGNKKKSFWIERGGKRYVNQETYAIWREWLRKPVDQYNHSLSRRKKVADVLPANIVAQCRAGQCQIGNFSAILFANENLADASSVRDEASQKMPIEQSSYVIGYDEAYKDAIAEFKARNYEGAAEKFKKMIADAPGNALLHNDLAATYNKLGRYDDAIAEVQKILHEICDKSQYGAAQYNAGYAYEKKGNLQKALANYKLAVANGNRRAQRDVTRVSNLLKKGSLQTSKNGKRKGRAAFNDASKKLRNNAHSADLSLTDLLRDENGLG